MVFSKLDECLWLAVLQLIRVSISKRLVHRQQSGIILRHGLVFEGMWKQSKDFTKTSSEEYWRYNATISYQILKCWRREVVWLLRKNLGENKVFVDMSDVRLSKQELCGLWQFGKKLQRKLKKQSNVYIHKGFEKWKLIFVSKKSNERWSWVKENIFNFEPTEKQGVISLSPHEIKSWKSCLLSKVGCMKNMKSQNGLQTQNAFNNNILRFYWSIRSVWKNLYE